MPSIEEIKARLAGLNRRTNKPQDLWKPKGAHEIRLLKNPHTEDPFIELYFHYDIGENSVLCPKSNSGDDCDICDACEKLKAWKDDGGNDKEDSQRKTDWELFKKIQPKARVFVAMLERGQEGNGPKYWSITPNQAGEILSFATDGDRLQLAGVSENNALDILVGTEKAFDLKVKFVPAGKEGNESSFGKVKIECKIVASPLAKDKKEAQAILGAVKNIKEVYVPLSSGEVSKLWNKFIGEGSPEAKAEGGSEYTAKAEAKRPANTTESAKNVGTRNIDAAFDDMMKE